MWGEQRLFGGRDPQREGRMGILHACRDLGGKCKIPDSIGGGGWSGDGGRQVAGPTRPRIPHQAFLGTHSVSFPSTLHQLMYPLHTHPPMQYQRQPDVLPYPGPGAQHVDPHPRHVS